MIDGQVFGPLSATLSTELSRHGLLNCFFFYLNGAFSFSFSVSPFNHLSIKLESVSKVRHLILSLDNHSAFSCDS